jgi:hypothetical protein
MTNAFSLDGLHERPFALRPEEFDILIYPAEWCGLLEVDPNLLGELSDIFYLRNYGRYSVYNLWTLFTRSAFADAFAEDVVLGYRNLLTDSLPESMPRCFYNDGFTLLQSAALKELRTDVDSYRKVLDNDYTAIPLVPAYLAIKVTGRFELGELYDAVRVSTLLRELNNFLGATT